MAGLWIPTWFRLERPKERRPRSLMIYYNETAERLAKKLG